MKKEQQGVDDDQVGLYDKKTHKPVKINPKVRYELHKQSFIQGNMSLKTLKDLGANVKTLVWEYITCAMDYDNVIQPNISEIAEIIDAHRTQVSNALTDMEKNLLIVQLGDSRKGRLGRKFMIDPYRVNRGSATELPKKRAKWNKVVKDQFEENKPKMSNDNVIDFPGDFN